MVRHHTREEVESIARKFASAEAIEVLETFIDRQNEKIADLQDAIVYGDDLAAYAAALGHQAAKAQAVAILHEVRRDTRIEAMTSDIVAQMERDFSDV